VQSVTYLHGVAKSIPTRLLQELQNTDGIFFAQPFTRKVSLISDVNNEEF
jgi:hypothetical protein|tara:strand:- start:4310 stop:4459 length:150 start_codon:yes stop_codon:yes gene_type:complete